MGEITPEFVVESLLRHNYLPTHKEKKEEMPPVLSSATLSEEVARALCNESTSAIGNIQLERDAVEYRLTRYNGVHRTCSIPHPAAYASLVFEIAENWSQLAYTEENPNSVIKPRRHKDGRITIMDYEMSRSAKRDALMRSFGMNYVAQADVANFFPSIYSHAIPWALAGHKGAKSKRNDNSVWFNKIDKKLRSMKRGETQGVAIGPGTSTILSEVILTRVDDELRQRYSFIRFVDDYHCYCENERDAIEFVTSLENELSKYKLQLNPRKTVIQKLPQPTSDMWVSMLGPAIPSGDVVSCKQALKIIDHAISLAQNYPDESVIKYATRCIVDKKLEGDVHDLLRRLLCLSFHKPLLLPLLMSVFESAAAPVEIFSASSIGEQYSTEIVGLIRNNAIYKHSDGLAWSLYYASKYGVQLPKDCVEEVIRSRDCVGILLLSRGSAEGLAAAVEYATRLDSSDIYELDQNWLLLYELFRNGNISNPYKDNCFQIMRDGGVTFITS